MMTRDVKDSFSHVLAKLVIFLLRQLKYVLYQFQEISCSFAENNIFEKSNLMVDML